MVSAREHFDRLEEEAAAIAGEVEELVGRLSEAELFRQPSPERWSVAHCLEHLAKTADLYLPQVREGIEGKRAVALDGEGEPEYRPGWFGRWFIRASGPGGRKVKAPRPFRPPEVPPPDAVERFVSRHRELRNLLAAARHVDPNKSRVKPPAVIPLVTFSVAEALTFLLGHERRHLEQAKKAVAAERPAG